MTDDDLIARLDALYEAATTTGPPIEWRRLRDRLTAAEAERDAAVKLIEQLSTGPYSAATPVYYDELVFAARAFLARLRDRST